MKLSTYTPVIMGEEEKTYTVKGIPAEVLQRYSAYCSLHGVSKMQDLIRYMQEKGDLVRVEPERKK